MEHTTDRDDWLQSMFDLQAELVKRQAAEVARLRKENRDLRLTIAAIPSDATGMQDRITMLETQLAEQKRMTLAAHLD